MDKGCLFLQFTDFIFISMNFLPFGNFVLFFLHLLVHIFPILLFLFFILKFSLLTTMVQLLHSGLHIIKDIIDCHCCVITVFLTILSLAYHACDICCLDSAIYMVAHFLPIFFFTIHEDAIMCSVV